MIIIFWIIIGAVVTWPHFAEIENLPDRSGKLAAFLLMIIGGPILLVATWIQDMLETVGINFDDDNFVT